MTRAKRLLVWRHGETEHNVSGIYQGHLDTDLSSTGVAQAARAAAALARDRPDRIVASDLRRAARTAQVLAELVEHPVEHDRRLREIDVGTWTGRKADDIAAAYPDQSRAIAAGEDPRRGEHGEELREVAQRTCAVATEVAASLASGQLAVLVTHGVASRAMVAALLGWSHQETWLGVAGLRNCRWAELVQHRTGWRLVSWNAGVDADPAPVST